MVHFCGSVANVSRCLAHIQLSKMVCVWTITSFCFCCQFGQFDKVSFEQYSVSFITVWLTRNWKWGGLPVFLKMPHIIQALNFHVNRCFSVIKTGQQETSSTQYPLSDITKIAFCFDDTSRKVWKKQKCNSDTSNQCSCFKKRGFVGLFFPQRTVHSSTQFLSLNVCLFFLGMENQIFSKFKCRKCLTNVRPGALLEISVYNLSLVRWSVSCFSLPNSEDKSSADSDLARPPVFPSRRGGLFALKHITDSRYANISSFFFFQRRV